MTALQALNKSLVHWDRMIKWVTRQDPTDKARSRRMEADIHESWYEWSCPLCQNFRCGKSCGIDCPLVVYGYQCTDDNSVWEQVANARTWGKWLSCAKNMVRMLKSCKRKESQKATRQKERET